MKKVSIIVVIIIVLTLVLYYFTRTIESEVSHDIKIKTPIQKKDKKIVQTKTQPSEGEVLTDEEFNSAQFDQYLSEVEDNWNKSIEDLFLDNTESGQRNIREYLKLKRGYEQERERRYEEFHEMMEKKHGPNYSYSPSAEEEMFNEKLVRIYEKNLSKIVGKRKMIEYLEVKDKFNQKLETESKDSNSYIQIEF